MESNTTSVKWIIAQIRKMMQRCGIQYDPQSGLCYYSGYGDSILTSEIYFDTIALSHMGADESLALNTFRVFLSSGHPDGHIRRHRLGPVSRIGYPRGYPNWDGFEEEEHAQPFLCQMALLISRIRGNTDWLSAEEYARLKRYLNHWLTDWDRDGNGLSEWASAPHSMADTQFDRAGVWHSYFCEGVDLNCYLYLELLSIAFLAKARNLMEDASYFAEQAERKKLLIQTIFWDDNDGFFYDRYVPDGKPIKVKAVGNFMPLWARLATPKQARQLVEAHLTNIEEFWTPYPIPSYARNEPMYTQYHQTPKGCDPLYYFLPGHCNWRGGMWPHTNYLIAHGLMNYDFIDEAEYISSRTFELVAADPQLYEWYNAETGEGQGAHPFWAGSEVLMSFLHTEIQVGFDPSKIDSVLVKFSSNEIWRKLGITEPFCAEWAFPT